MHRIMTDIVMKYRGGKNSFSAQSWTLIAVNQPTLWFVTYSVKYFFSLTVPFTWFHLILCNTGLFFSSPAIHSICKILKLCPFEILSTAAKLRLVICNNVTHDPSVSQYTVIELDLNIPFNYVRTINIWHNHAYSKHDCFTNIMTIDKLWPVARVTHSTLLTHWPMTHDPLTHYSTVSSAPRYTGIALFD